MKAIAYEPAEGLNRVTLALGDETIVVEDGYETDDPAVAAALDALDTVQRAEAKPSKGGEGAAKTTPKEDRKP